MYFLAWAYPTFPGDEWALLSFQSLRADWLDSVALAFAKLLAEFHPEPRPQPGIDDVVLPACASGPVTVVVDAQQVPVGTVVTLNVNPVQGDITTQDTRGLAGTLENSTANADITFPEGASAISASTTFSLPDPVAFLGPRGEAILAVEITARPGEPSEARYIAANGARYPRSALVAVAR